MSPVRLGAVEYLNARPLVYGLDRSSRFSLRFDVPSRCAELLHDRQIDVGLIPSIEYLRGPADGGSRGAGRQGYRIVPGIAIASRGPVASVAVFTQRPIREVRSLALDTSSRSSVALARVLCARVFGIEPAFTSRPPDLETMLAAADAALLIGDRALFLEGGALTIDGGPRTVEKIDLGDVWTRTTGLPFVYAFWAGAPDVLTAADVEALHAAKDQGIRRADAVSRAYFRDAPERSQAGAAYLRDNIRYDLGADERAGLELFYKYAAETGVVERADPLLFY